MLFKQKPEVKVGASPAEKIANVEALRQKQALGVQEIARKPLQLGPSEVGEWQRNVLEK